MSAGLAAQLNRQPRKRVTIRERDGDNCWLCGAVIDFTVPPWDDMGPTLDHVIPRSKGGRNANGNLRLAHRVCNTERGDDDARVERRDAVIASQTF